MCQISTGGGYAARKKYTDDDENAIEVLRPQILNGIAEV
jgi:hypothetical protein